jgi:hypothetical protein
MMTARAPASVLLATAAGCPRNRAGQEIRIE